MFLFSDTAIRKRLYWTFSEKLNFLYRFSVFVVVASDYLSGYVCFYIDHFLNIMMKQMPQTSLYVRNPCLSFLFPHIRNSFSVFAPCSIPKWVEAELSALLLPATRGRRRVCFHHFVWVRIKCSVVIETATGCLFTEEVWIFSGTN